MILAFSPSRLSDTPRRPKRAPRAHQDGPRGLREGPKTAQEGPKTAQEASKTAQEASKRAPRGAQEGKSEVKFRALRPEMTPEIDSRRPRGPQEAPTGPTNASKKLPRGSPSDLKMPRAHVPEHRYRCSRRGFWEHRPSLPQNSVWDAPRASETVPDTSKTDREGPKTRSWAILAASWGRLRSSLAGLAS